MIDDDQALCRSLQIQLKSEGHVLRFVNQGGEAESALRSEEPELILLDLNLPDTDGLTLLPQLLELLPGVPVVMVTGQQDMQSTIQAMRLGAFDYIRKPFAIEDILLALEKAGKAGRSSRSSRTAAEETEPYEIIGADRGVVEVIKQIGLLSQTAVTVLVQGESGTGKELVARALHQASCPDRPFVAINCSAVVPTLFESELFGHEKGAFTGADARRIGKLEQAEDGTVFLDEIGDMPLDLQAKLLRVLQQQEFERVGGGETIPFHARVVAATHQDLAGMVKEGDFREDLYYRLAVSPVVMPALRERSGDIPLLVRHLLTRIGCKLHRKVERIEDAALKRLQAYAWPGNVRELENVLTRSVALSRGPVLTLEDLSVPMDGADAEAPASPDAILPLREMEKQYVQKALIATGWNVTQTARLLEISPTTLRKKITDYELQS